MASGGDLSPVAKAWAWLLALAACLLLIVLTIAAFASSAIGGIFWLVFGDPIAATLLYWLGTLLVLPVAAATGGLHIRPTRGALLSAPCTIVGVRTAERAAGLLEFLDAGLLCKQGGGSGPHFGWENVDSFDDNGDVGLVVNVLRGGYRLSLDDVAGDNRNDWILELTEQGVPRASTIDRGQLAMSTA